MSGIKINKVFMLMVLIIELIYAQGLVGISQDIPPGRTVPENIITAVRVEISIPFIPKIGEVFEATLTIYCKDDLKPDKRGRPGPDYKVVFESDAAIIEGREHIIYDYPKRGEIRRFKAKMVIKEARERVGIGGGIITMKRPQFAQGTGIEIFLIDPENGQYGTREEYERGLSVEYRYDFVDGSFIGRYDQSRVSLAENRRIIKMMKELEPSLTDSLALLLHSEQYKVGVPKGTAKWDSLNQRWIDKGVYEYYLKDGWLKAVQEGRLMEWEENEKVKIQKEWKGGGGINFFRPGRDIHSVSGCNRLIKTFDGYWKFKDHLYNRDQGLLADAVKKPVKNARARIYITYQISGVPYRYVSEQCITNENGYFSITTELPNSFELGKAFAVVYPAGGGPDTASPVINVSDGYDHAYAINEILLHHRIRDSIPAKPIGLSAAQVGNAVRLYWRKNSESDLQGYRIYRRSKKEFVIPPQPWGSWGFLADKGSPNDTTHLDQTVQSGWRYRYKVTAYDSLGNESDYSDSVEIFVQFGINPDDIEMFSFYVPPIIYKKDDLRICFSTVINNQKITLRLYDICGRLVQKQDVILKKGGDNRFSFDSKSFSSGVYFVQLETKDYNKIQKIVIVR